MWGEEWSFVNCFFNKFKSECSWMKKKEVNNFKNFGWFEC